ncbi:hypothetical protein [Halomontanus rarus]|uniref:hypothetical protein n=1 Tax=Halomontanus rarus TaxID=3034020 RepID=UPI0023E8775A|nr:hypothetical protein [Halovivax sp. TS33]
MRRRRRSYGYGRRDAFVGRPLEVTVVSEKVLFGLVLAAIVLLMFATGFVLVTM